MSPKICDDSRAISAVQVYIRKIRNPRTRQFADDFWSAIYNEAAGNRVTYPDERAYDVSYKAADATRSAIVRLIAANRTVY